MSTEIVPPVKSRHNFIIQVVHSYENIPASEILTASV